MPVLAYDGDADRCIAVDNEGNVVDGDRIMYICGKYMKEQGSLFNIRLLRPLCLISDCTKPLTEKGFPMKRQQ